MQNYIVIIMIKCRIELYIFYAFSWSCKYTYMYLELKNFCDCFKLHDIVITVTINEINVFDNRINIEGSIQLKVQNDLK